MTETTNQPTIAIEKIDFRHLSVDERIRLAQQLWDSISEEELPPPTEAEKAELERRWREHEANPNDVVPWEDIKNRLRSKP